MSSMYYPLRLSILLVCVFFVGCWSPEKEKDMKDSSQKLVVVNVLEAPEHQDAHIRGSINVPLSQLKEAARNWAKGTRIVVYCANYMCTSSTEAARQLQKLGFQNVLAYEGGTAEWHSKGYPLDGPAKAGYLTNVGRQHLPVPTDVKLINAEELKNEMERAEPAGLLITK